MGNPELPHLFERSVRPMPPEASRRPPITARARRLVYKVFLLRDHDQKLPAERVRETMLMGHLRIVPSGEDEQAVLYDASGTELRRLHSARTRRMQVTGDILLRGIEVRQMRLGIAESRQAWWCELQHPSVVPEGDAAVPPRSADAG